MLFYFGNVSVVVVSFDWEGFGMVVVEVLLFGIFVILIDCFVGFVEMFVIVVGGFFVFCDNVDVLIYMMWYVLEICFKVDVLVYCCVYFEDVVVFKYEVLIWYLFG